MDRSFAYFQDCTTWVIALSVHSWQILDPIKAFDIYPFQTTACPIFLTQSADKIHNSFRRGATGGGAPLKFTKLRHWLFVLVKGDTLYLKAKSIQNTNCSELFLNNCVVAAVVVGNWSDCLRRTERERAGIEMRYGKKTFRCRPCRGWCDGPKEEGREEKTNEVTNEKHLCRTRISERGGGQ